MLYKNELLKIPPAKPDRKLGNKKTTSYLGVAQIIDNAKCGEVFNFDIYTNNREKLLLVRFFSDGNTFCIYRTKDTEWLKTQLYFALTGMDKYAGYSYRYDDEMVTSPATLQTTKTFFNQTDHNRHLTVAMILEDFISSYKTEQRIRAEERKAERLSAHMKMFPKYPKDIRDYLTQNVFPKYIFTEKLVKGKKPGRCSFCGKKIWLDRSFKHKQVTTCPKCGSEVTVFERRYISSVKDKAEICIADKVDSQILIRWAKVRREWILDSKQKAKAQFYIWDYFRMLRVNNKSYCYDYKNIYPWGEYWREQNKYINNSLSYVYTPNLTDVFGPSYHNVNLTITLNSSQQVRFFPLLDNLKNIPATEYLTKLGMSRLASEIYPSTLGEGNNFHSILGVNPQYKELYKKYNISLMEHRIIQSATAWISEDDFIKLRNLKLPSFEVNDICYLLGKMSLRRFVNYFTKQKAIHRKIKIEQLLQWYEDYIKMSEQMHIDLSHKGVLFPRDIKEAHDNLITKYDKVKYQLDDERLRRASKNLYAGLTEFTSGDYAIVFPRTRTEFIQEGQALSHCVGTQSTYFKNHLEGEKMIFFIRRASELKKPFVTMEVNMRQCTILQIYGYADKPPAKEVRRFAEKFVKQIKQQSIREEIKNAS